LKSFPVKFHIRKKRKEMFTELSAIVAMLLQLAGNNLTHFVIYHEDSEPEDEASLEVTDRLAYGFSSVALLRLFATSGIPIGASALAVLSTAPNLRELEVLLADDVQTLAPGSTVFPRMKELVLKGSTSSCAALIASLMAPSHVEVLRVIFVDETVSGTPLGFSHMVPSVLGDQLRILRLKSSTSFPSNILPPLFECRKLKTIRIPIDLEANESPSDIKAQARRAWRSIVSLRLRR
jgi:hypothetical protein